MLKRVKHPKKVKNEKNKNIRNQRGITLLALVITIIVLLILAEITISAITGDNGIIGNAGQAKEETEIANEKEILEKAIVQSMGNIVEEELQSELDKETGEGKTQATDAGEEFEVLFKESNRYYTVDKDGNVGEVNIYEEDEYPGDITVGKDGETLDGSEEKPYEIWCIEDLVKLSQMVNEENQSFANKYIVLKTNLKFNSNFSYMNPDTTEFDTYLGGDGTTSLIEQLSKDGNGFVPIGKDMYGVNFKGIFDGQNYMVENIYINKSSNAGLFGCTTNRAEICNLTVQGNIIVGEGESNPLRAGGIVAWAGTTLIENCHSQVSIRGKAYGMGGIVGICQYGNVEIKNCINQEELENTYNSTGGIIGVVQDGIQVDIVNTYNLAKIKDTRYVGGIIGITNNNMVTLRNVYTIGKINCSTTKGGIVGQIQDSSKIDCNYVYYKKADDLVGIYNQNDSDFQINGYTEDEWNNTQIVTLLNEGRQKQEENINKQEWKLWKLGEENYPVFE